MSTIEQVAKVANVSVATVSRVINNSALVSEKTRKKVELAIKKLNYEPNYLGRSLRQSETNMVLAMVHGIDNPFFSQIIRGIESVAHAHGINVLICTTYGDSTREMHYLEMLKRRYVDGAILLSSCMDVDELDQLDENFPIVQVVENLPASKAVSVSVDYYQASVQLMEHLIQSGHRNIVFIHTGLQKIISSTEKFRAYTDTLKKHGLPVLSERIRYNEFGFDSGKEIVSHCLSDHPKIDAVFAASDLVACGVINEIEKRGLRVPEDIAVAGFDNTIYANINKPRITTVDQNSFELGSTAMKLLLQKIRRTPLEQSRVQVAHRLIIQGSTDSNQG
ncbi:MAG: LacI family DNA-binding transcriptional regulator [Erysipelotrichaceae bacterium]